MGCWARYLLCIVRIETEQYSGLKAKPLRGHASYRTTCQRCNHASFSTIVHVHCAASDRVSDRRVIHDQRSMLYTAFVSNGHVRTLAEVA